MVFDQQAIQEKLSNIDFSKIVDGIKLRSSFTARTELIKKYVDGVSFELIEGGFEKISETSKTMLSLITYLFDVEGRYTHGIDLIIYYIIKEEPKKLTHKKDKEFKKIKKFEDLYKPTLDRKLNFLKRHGFQEVSDICNKELRNSIAHNDFLIKPNGEIAYIVDNKTVILTNLNLRKLITDIDSFIAFLNTYEGHSWAVRMSAKKWKEAQKTD